MPAAAGTLARRLPGALLRAGDLAWRVWRAAVRVAGRGVALARAAAVLRVDAGAFLTSTAWKPSPMPLAIWAGVAFQGPFQK